MSLAPLYPDLANDLHVRTATVLHQGFPWLQPAWEKLAIFRVPANVLDFKSLSKKIRIELCCTQCEHRDHRFMSLSLRVVRPLQGSGFITITLAHSVDSSVRVTRRVV